nr:ComF family protein [Azoarcus sp. L1K30]
MRALINHALNVVMPQDCFLCAARSYDQPLCAACRAELPAQLAPGCPICALPTPSGAVCGHCLVAPPAFDATRAAFDYGFPIDVLVQALKYRHRLSLAAFFARAIGELKGDFDLIVPMPLHARRLAERGFNQAVEIARPLAKSSGVPMVLAGVARVRDTPSQASLGRAARVSNMRAAFACELKLDRRSVLVIDDVMTTGASLDALARCLKAQGARRVENCVVARTPAAL